MNHISSIRTQFIDELSNKFSKSEIKLILKTSISKRLNLSSTEFLLLGNVELSQADHDYFMDCIYRLKKDEPFQYIIGTTEFFGLELKCDSRALIPRPETEELVFWITQSMVKDPIRIADICSGSGCIGLALKSVNPLNTVDALELSEKAMSLIEENSDALGLNLNIIKFDALAANYNDLPGSYSIIVSNPPYIPSNEISKLNINVLDHEPHMALFVENEDPLIFYQTISFSSINLLVDDGWLFFEVHEDFSEGVAKLMHSAGFVNIELRKDLQGKQRMIRGQKVLSHHE